MIRNFIIGGLIALGFGAIAYAQHVAGTGGAVALAAALATVLLAWACCAVGGAADDEPALAQLGKHVTDPSGLRGGVVDHGSVDK